MISVCMCSALGSHGHSPLCIGLNIFGLHLWHEKATSNEKENIKIYEKSMKKLERPQKKETKTELLPGVMPDLCGLTIRKAIQVAARENISLKIMGSGIVRRQSIQPGSRITNNTTCIIEASI